MLTLILFFLGLYLGVTLGYLLTKAALKSNTEFYKQQSDEWFKSYMEMLKWYQEMSAMYYEEALKNIGPHDTNIL